MTIKKEKDSKIEYLYDEYFDFLGVKKKAKYTYLESIEISEGLILDFDNNGVPVALEILDASERFKVPKNSFNNIQLIRLAIAINEEIIKVNLTLDVLVDNKSKEKEISAFIANVNCIPSLKVHLGIE